MTRLTLFRLTLGLLVALSACGGDDKPSGGAGSGGGAGGKGSAAGSGGSTGTGTGSGKEGNDCKTDADCGSGLNCIAADALQINSTQEVVVSVCARKCTDDKDCMSNETCFSFSGKPANALCWNLTTEAGKPCGPGDTSICDEDSDLQCAVVRSDSGDSLADGECIKNCKVASPDCPAGLSCLFSDGTDGVCAKQLDRGASCGEDIFSDCGPSDVCITDGTTGFCLQDCTKSMMCDEPDVHAPVRRQRFVLHVSM
jgi:hypothetical protein